MLRNKKDDEQEAEHRSALLIQVGRIEEKLDNLSNKVSFEHGHLKQDTSFVATSLRDLAPTIVELETLKRDLLEKISGLAKAAPQVELRVPSGRKSKVSNGIINLLGDGRERSVTEITNDILGEFPEYKANSLRVVVNRKLTRLVANGKVEARDSKNKKLYCRKL